MYDAILMSETKVYWEGRRVAMDAPTRAVRVLSCKTRLMSHRGWRLRDTLLDLSTVLIDPNTVKKLSSARQLDQTVRAYFFAVDLSNHFLRERGRLCQLRFFATIRNITNLRTIENHVFMC